MLSELSRCMGFHGFGPKTPSDQPACCGITGPTQSRRGCGAGEVQQDKCCLGFPVPITLGTEKCISIFPIPDIPGSIGRGCAIFKSQKVLQMKKQSSRSRECRRGRICPLAARLPASWPHCPPSLVPAMHRLSPIWQVGLEQWD